MAHEPAAACMLAEAPMPANRSPGSRLGHSRCPLCRGWAAVLVDPGDVLVAAQATGHVSSNAASADLLVCGRAAAAAPPARRLGHA
jgi:hypothetical protein